MKITKQTSSQLVLHAPTSAGCITGLILAIPGLLLVLFFILPLLGVLNYSSLNCSRNTPPKNNCQFLRISLLQPFYYQFSLDEFQNISIKRRISRVGSKQETQYRLMLAVEQKEIRLTNYYSSRTELANTQSQIREFFQTENLDSLNIHFLPNGLGIIFLVMLLMIAIPYFSFVGMIILAIFTIVPCTCTFDKITNSVTWHKKGLLSKKRHCKLTEICLVEIESKSHNNYLLQLQLNSGNVFNIYNYMHHQEATQIAGHLRDFLKQ